MAKKEQSSGGGPRAYLAYATLIFSVIAITVLAGIAIANDPDNAMTVFNIILPVFASWVGTILAFYFGRENFESANKQVRELVQRITPEQRAEAPVTAIMRTMSSTVHLEIPQGKDDKDIKISEMLKLLAPANVSRLPITDAERKPRYLIHESSIDKYVAAGGAEDDDLATLVDKQKKEGHEFGLNAGFVLVSENTSLAAAKRKVEAVASCQDILVSKDGSPDEPLTGWISNIRLAKYLEA